MIHVCLGGGIAASAKVSAARRVSIREKCIAVVGFEIHGIVAAGVYVR